MLKTSTIFMMAALLLALSGCGVGEDSGIIPTNGASAGDGSPDAADGEATDATNPGDGATDSTYDPCADEVCGEVCQLCDPADADCVETSEIKACNQAGECVSDTGDLCNEVDPEPYEPCGGKACGDMCQQCDPDDLDCIETGVLKACDPQGDCVADTGDLCDDQGYDACAGKSCGDMCTLCDPADLDCAETMEIKACNPDGVCVSDTGDLCDEVSACADSALPADNFMAGLEWAGGCGDMLIYAASPDGTMEVNLSIWGLCEEAHSSGGVLTRTYNLPDSGVGLDLNIGSNVSGATCNDALDWENPVVINHSIAATAGTITISATPDGEARAWSIPTVVSVTLSDAVFTDIDGCTSTVTNYTWTDVYVGWMAG